MTPVWYSKYSLNSTYHLQWFWRLIFIIQRESLYGSSHGWAKTFTREPKKHIKHLFDKNINCTCVCWSSVCLHLSSETNRHSRQKLLLKDALWQQTWTFSAQQRKTRVRQTLKEFRIKPLYCPATTQRVIWGRLFVSL